MSRFIEVQGEVEKSVWYKKGSSWVCFFLAQTGEEVHTLRRLSVRNEMSSTDLPTLE